MNQPNDISQTIFPKEELLFAEVIIPLALPKNFTWSIPVHLQDAVKPGVRVEVILGKNKRYAGLVKRIFSEKPAAFDPKPIINVLDNAPLLYPHQLQLWQWISNYYMCAEGDVMQVAIPSNLKLSSETIIVWNDEHDEEFSHLDDKEYIVAEALAIKKELRLNEIQQLLDSGQVYPVIKQLIDKQICFVWEELKEKYKAKKETYVTLLPPYNEEEHLAKLLNEWSKAPKQLEVLLAYLHLIKTEGEVTQTQLLKKSGATAAQLKGLIDKKILHTEKRSVGRLATLPKNISIDFELSNAQQKAMDEILHHWNDKQVCLLHGVTASGKTQLYINLIAQCIEQGKQALYMLPEIALTAQIIRRLQHHFGGHIAVYHSKFNPNERVEIWNKVKDGEIKVVLGARSALFLPFNDLGLIVIDEEHDPSYKQQEPTPRYHARDAAIYYASLLNSKVLLGSATPSLESFYNATQGKYGLITLSQRFGNVDLPVTELVNLKKATTPDEEKIILTAELTEEIEKSLAHQKQVILFQNRRGYSPYVKCGVCEWIPHCEHCDVTLTYHKAKNKLVCHYCGTTYPLIHTCAACGSNHFVQKNFGTEKIEETLEEIFPHANIARMDHDSVKGKDAHDTLIKMFEQQRVNILVGTQMVVKGLDFEHVNLVGIVDADGILNFADFRVNERAYQLMEQVSGRAGRKDGAGRVLIQVSNMQHPVLQFVQEHNYNKLYNFEIANRQQFFYPPFSRLIKIIVKHKYSNIAEEASHLLINGLKQVAAQYISGPAEPYINRIRNQYLWEILLKLPKNPQLINNCKHAIRQQIAVIQSNKIYRSVTFSIDVDPN